ncbi:hypothetical protein EMN47_15460 [Prolixibacteraceae bacterium JC049]|nr:hypothetical protein [Prolixibacteraceae bacterium JC049]
MKNKIYRIIIVALIGLLGVNSSFAQVLNNNRLSKQDSAIIAQPINKRIFSPKKAALMSAIVPGLGQIYNRKYWKLPLVYGGIVGFGALVIWNNNKMQDTKRGLKEFFDDNPDTRFYDNVLHYTKEEFIANGWGNEAGYNAWAESSLKKGRDGYRRNRDLSFLGFMGFYLLQILDATVDAHFKNFDISDDLSLNIDPVQQQNPLTGRPYYGLKCQITF